MEIIYKKNISWGNSLIQLKNPFSMKNINKNNYLRRKEEEIQIFILIRLIYLMIAKIVLTNNLKVKIKLNKLKKV
jgi:hypothetical protein